MKVDVKTVTENGKDYYVIDYSQNIKKLIYRKNLE